MEKDKPTDAVRIERLESAVERLAMQIANSQQEITVLGCDVGALLAASRQNECSEGDGSKAE